MEKATIEFIGPTVKSCYLWQCLHTNIFDIACKKIFTPMTLTLWYNKTYDPKLLKMTREKFGNEFDKIRLRTNDFIK